MSDLDSFLLTLWNEPDDHTARLVFADFLGDRDDPREERVRAAPDTWTALVPFGYIGEQTSDGKRLPLIGHCLQMGKWDKMQVNLRGRLTETPFEVRLPAIEELLGIEVQGGSAIDVPQQLIRVVASAPQRTPLFEISVGSSRGFSWKTGSELILAYNLTIALSGQIGLSFSLSISAKFPN